MANPLTYYERYLCVRAALQEAGLPSDAYSVVPFPINFPELYQYYVPLDAVFYLTIYDDWGRRKLELFQSIGLRAEVMWERSADEKGLNGSEVRRSMVQGRPWEDLVPGSVADLMKRWKIPQRLQSMGEAGSAPDVQFP